MITMIIIILMVETLSRTPLSWLENMHAQAHPVLLHHCRHLSCTYLAHHALESVLIIIIIIIIIIITIIVMIVI